MTLRNKLLPLFTAAVCVAVSVCCGCIKGPDFPYMLSPRAIVQTPTNPANANIAVSFQLIDREKEPGNIILEYSTDSGVSFKSATLVDPSETQNLPSDWFPGIIHTVGWDSVIDMVGRSAAVAVRVKVTPSDATNPAGGTSDISGEFTVNNIAFNEPPDVTVATPLGVQSHNIQINYSLTDIEGDACSVLVEYSTDGGSTYQAATKSWLGEGVSGLSSSGAAHIFVWDSRADNVGLAGQQDNVKIRITPSDFHATGTADETDSLSVDNSIVNNAPTVAITDGPEEGSTVYTNQVTFTWSGSDSDGTVVGYYYSFDRDPPNTWTTATSVTSGVLPDGEHIFRLVALDNDEALSSIATRTFTVLFVPRWAKSYGGTGYDWAESIRQTSDGGYVVAGYTQSFGAGNTDFCVLKLNSDGTVFWQKTYGGANYDEANSIQQTSDGGYIVAGYTQSFGAGFYDFCVLKLNSDGTVSWQKTYGGAGHDYASSIQQTSDSGYIVTGITLSFGAGAYYDFWVLKLTSTGTVSWQKRYGGTSDDYANSIQQTSDGGYIVAGYTQSFGADSYDFWVLKLNSDGTVAWQKTYGGANYDDAYSIQQTSDDGYIVAGRTSSFGAGSYDFWVLKLNSDGAVAWQKRYGGADWELAYSIQQTSDGGYIVAGYTQSFGAGSYDFWVLKLNSNGIVAWQKRYGGADWELAYSIQQTSDGGYIVAGWTESFGVGGEDFWVLKLNSAGTIPFNPASGAQMVDTNAIPTATNATIADTTATVTNTSATVTATNATVVDTNATIEQQAP
jgi:uncharacterized delta-60 repeat protein